MGVYFIFIRYYTSGRESDFEVVQKVRTTFLIVMIFESKVRVLTE